MEIAIVVTLLLVLLLSGIPLAYSVGMTGIAGLFLFFGGFHALPQVAHILSRTLQDFVLSSVPLFLLMSQILLKAGIGHDLFEVASKWVRHIPGGLGASAVVACGIFAAISGSSPATAATIGTVAVPEMVSRGYDKKLTYGTLVGSGALGILIPPSIPMILYGLITGESVGKLFTAGIIPGLMTVVIMCTYLGFTARSGKCKVEPSATWSDRLSTTWRALWALLAIPIVLGGIYAGLFTPTEAAAVGVVYSLIVGMFVYRTITWRNLPAVLLEGTKNAAMILFIVAAAMIFGHLITLMQVPAILTEFIAGLPVAPWVILVLFNILFIILGMFLEPAPIILIVLPVLWPVIHQLGWDPIWFAIVMTINLELGCITPPVGMNLYVIKGISDAKLSDVLIGSLPFALIHAIMLALVMIFPQIPLFLVNTMQ